MIQENNVEQLISLANDLYTEGHVCGISGADSDKWFTAWAIAMQRVASGEPYTQDLVGQVFNSLHEMTKVNT